MPPPVGFGWHIRSAPLEGFNGAATSTTKSMPSEVVTLVRFRLDGSTVLGRKTSDMA